MKDCCNCCLWDPSEEECKAGDLREFDLFTFYEICPKSNGEWSESSTED